VCVCVCVCVCVRHTQAHINRCVLWVGGCGKSTILKQLRLLHVGGFSEQERKAQIEVIKGNVISTLITLSRACIKYKMELSPAFVEAEEQLSDGGFGYTCDMHLAVCTALWKDSSVQRTLELYGDELTILDSAKHFCNQLDTIFSQSYLPTDADMLAARVTTNGVVEIDMPIEKRMFRMLDVGGQRGQRSYWMHVLDDASAILYLASLADYNLKLEEDLTKNRLDESFAVFGCVEEVMSCESCAMFNISQCTHPAPQVRLRACPSLRTHRSCSSSTRTTSSEKRSRSERLLLRRLHYVSLRLSK
jgi:hypothetical protein